MTEVFAAFPYGLLVVGGDGAVLAFNRSADRLLGGVLRSGRRRTSCELLGCGRSGPLADVCLTRLAIERGGALPEIRIDLPGRGRTTAAWVTAAPLHRGGPTVLVELRPGDALDRRRRTVPHWTTGAHLRIRTLGATAVESHEGPLTGQWLDQRPGQLLKFLVAERDRVVLREEIAETIWPGADPRVLGRLRHFMHVLRAHLEPSRSPREPSSFIVSAHGGYGLDRARVSIDADDFEAEASQGFAALAEGAEPAARRHLERALELYGGDFLSDEPYADWAIVQRDRLRGLASDALRALAAMEQRAGDLESASSHMARLGELDPFDVDVHRDIITLCLARGRRSEAMRRHAALRMRVMRTFGEDIGFSLADLQAAAAMAAAMSLPI